METTNFELLFSECYAYCMPVLKRKTFDTQLAEDAFLEAMTTYWMKVEDNTLKHQNNIPSFVCTIAVRLLYRSQQKLKKKNQLERHHNEDPLITEIIEEFSDSGDDSLDFLKTEFEKLGLKCRNLIFAKYVYNHSYKEIAEDFGIKSMEAAKTMTYRCFKKLKNYLSEKEKGHKILKK